MDYIINNDTYLSHIKEFRIVTSLDEETTSNILKLWKELQNIGDGSINYVNGFVSHGKDIYAKVSDTIEKDFKLFEWLNDNISFSVEEDLDPFNSIPMMKRGVLPKPISILLEELDNVSVSPQVDYSYSPTTFEPEPEQEQEHALVQEQEYNQHVSDDSSIFGSRVSLSDGIHNYDVYPDEEITIGRGSKSSFRFRVDGISRIHAIFKIINGVLYVKDNNSTNGTKVNGVRVQANKWFGLAVGDELRMGRCVLTVSYSSFRR